MKDVFRVLQTLHDKSVSGLFFWKVLWICRAKNPLFLLIIERIR